LTYAPQRGYDRLWKEALAPIKKLRKAWTTAYKSPVYQIGITRDGKEYRQLARSGAGIVERRPIWYWDNDQKKLIFEKPM
jgi:hypothetical protein